MPLGPRRRSATRDLCGDRCGCLESRGEPEVHQRSKASKVHGERGDQDSHSQAKSVKQLHAAAPRQGERYTHRDREARAKVKCRTQRASLENPLTKRCEKRQWSRNGKAVKIIVRIRWSVRRIWSIFGACMNYAGTGTAVKGTFEHQVGSGPAEAGLGRFWGTGREGSGTVMGQKSL